MGTKNNTAIPEEKSKVCFLRVIFIASLVVAAVVCGAVTYHVVRGLENEVGARTFESVTASLLQAAKARTLRNVQSGELMVTYLSFAFPNASMWPLVALDGYIETAGKAANLLSAISFVLSMIVRPDQATEFERFAARVYKNQGYAEGAGTSDFGFGIWAKDEDSPYPDGKIHDISGNTTYGSEHSILVPVFLHNIRDAESLMYNSHSDIFRGAAIDSMLECAQAASSTSVDPQCDVVTDFVELFSIPGPAALLFQPVYPVNDPTTIVAMVSTSMNWEVVFTNAVPGYVDGLHCVVSTGTKTYTYVVRNGLPRLVGLGDLHDPAFDSHAKSVILNNITTGASASASYTLTVYPTSRMFAAFQTNVPLALSLGFVAIVIFCAALFFLYDFFIRHKSRQRKIILEVKRSFVRFVSHEIRTPLNTVCLGLELLQAEMRTISDKDSSNDARNGNANRVSADADLGKSWLDLTSDIIENSNNAVEILNDLLNYDKIETGTFKLEIGKVHMWELVHKTVSAFDIQAKQREIRLTLTKGKEKCDIADVDVGGAGIPDLTRLHVLGDDVRLRQVIQNLVLNALKFSTDKTGAIDVEVAHEPHGLAKAAVPRMDAFKKSLMNALECDYARAGSILISVRDNGAGMTQEQLGCLFEEGVQFDANKLQCGGGSGLGLRISKGLVEQHGGTITAESAGPGLGTTVTTELPLYEFPEVERAQTIAMTESTVESVLSVERNSATMTRHVLVVDDSLPNRKMLVRLLERSGHICASASNGQEAILAFEADQIEAATDPSHSPIDTILMDYEMPVLNGPEATKVLREKGCNALVVGITGNVLADDVAYFMSMGADAVLSKPVNVALLEQCWQKFNI